jgi:ribosomal protein S14
MLRYSFHNKTWIKKDMKLRLKYKNIEINKKVLKSLIAFTKELDKKVYYSKLLSKFPNKVSISYFRNGCYSSGSGRSVFRLFMLNRHEAKHLTSYGLISGMRKSSF